MYQELIKEHEDLILHLYLHEGYKKAQIAHKLINDFDIDLTNAQVDSFRRSLSQFLSDYEEAHPTTVVENGEVKVKYKFDNQPITRAKVLILDLETTPIIAAIWKLYRLNHVNIEQVITDTNLLCWAAKWLFEPDIFGDVLTPEEAIAKDDSRIVKSLWKAMDEADIIMAHNGRRFDIPMANTFFVKNGLKPPSPYEIIDTNEAAKKTFRFSSNKLDFINRMLKLPKKLETEFELWLHCMDGKVESLNRMFEYNKHDVGILEENYAIIRPWIKVHPNMGFYVESDTLICPACGHTEVEEYGTYRTPVNEYIAYRCPNCGAVGRSRYSSTSVAKKKTLTISLGR